MTLTITNRDKNLAAKMLSKPPVSKCSVARA